MNALLAAVMETHATTTEKSEKEKKQLGKRIEFFRRRGKKGIRGEIEADRVYIRIFAVRASACCLTLIKYS